MTRPPAGSGRLGPVSGDALWIEDGSQVTLGATLAKAGEGTIYEVVDRSDWVAKVFHADLPALGAKLDKVAAMIAAAPAGAVQGDGFVVLAWPLHLMGDRRGPLGFIMPGIDTSSAVEIHSLSNPYNRLNPTHGAPQWTATATWGHLVNVAANLCLAVQTAHRVDAVIGDFQERNILVANTTRVTLVDCDSMQFTDAAGRQFLCALGRPEFTAPELAGVDLRTTPRGKSSDLFALAVHIHLLLMAGNHPFMRGTWTGYGEQPDALALAQAGDWAGGPHSRLDTHPLAPPVTFLPPAIQDLFTRAFTDGARDPGARPTATDWRQALTGLRIQSCDREPNHQIPLGCPSCPWCVIDAERHHRRSRVRPGLVHPYGEVVDYSAFALWGPTPYGALGMASPVAMTPSVPTPMPVVAGALRRPRRVPSKALLSAGAAMLLLAVLVFIVWAGDGVDAPAPIVTATGGVEGEVSTPTNSPGTGKRWDALTTTPGDVDTIDVHGFVHHADARCVGDDLAAVTARTSKSVLVICRASDSDTYYYKRFQPPMGGATVLQATRQGIGFEIIDHSDGSQHEVTPAGLTIVRHGTVVATEPTLQYVTNP